MPDIEPVPARSVPAPAVERVRALLAAAGLNPPADEVEIMAAGYQALRAAADRLYPLVYDDDPAPVFDPVRLFRAARDA